MSLVKIKNDDQYKERWIGRPENTRREGRRIVYETDSGIERCEEPDFKFLVTVSLSNGDRIPFGIYLHGLFGRKKGYDRFTSLLKSDGPRLENVLVAWQSPAEWTRSRADLYVTSLFENDFTYKDSTGTETRVFKNAIVSISINEMENCYWPKALDWRNVYTV